MSHISALLSPTIFSCWAVHSLPQRSPSSHPLSGTIRGPHPACNHFPPELCRPKLARIVHSVCLAESSKEDPTSFKKEKGLCMSGQIPEGKAKRWAVVGGTAILVHAYHEEERGVHSVCDESNPCCMHVREDPACARTSETKMPPYPCENMPPYPEAECGCR